MSCWANRENSMRCIDAAVPLTWITDSPHYELTCFSHFPAVVRLLQLKCHGTCCCHTHRAEISLFVSSWGISQAWAYSLIQYGAGHHRSTQWGCVVFVEDLGAPSALWPSQDSGRGVEATVPNPSLIPPFLPLSFFPLFLFVFPHATGKGLTQNLKAHVLPNWKIGTMACLLKSLTCQKKPWFKRRVRPNVTVAIREG